MFHYFTYNDDHKKMKVYNEMFVPKDNNSVVCTLFCSDVLNEKIAYNRKLQTMGQTIRPIKFIIQSSTMYRIDINTSKSKYI